MSHYFNLLYVGRMKRPGLLNTDSAGVLAHREGGAAASALLLQDNAFKHLNSLAVTLFDLAVYFYGIADTEFRRFCL